MGAFLTVCMNPTLQKTLCFSSIVPGQVNRTDRHRLDASGKGINVTRVLCQLGKTATHLTQLGGELRPFFLALCKKDGLEIEWVESAGAVRFCYTLISGDRSTEITELVEEGEQVDAPAEERFLKKYKTLLPSFGTVIFSGAKARGFSDNLVPLMVCLARERGARIILDMRGSDLVKSLPYCPDIIKPNLFEFTGTFAPELKKLGELSGDEEGVKDRVREIALELAERHHCRIILSRGSRPLWYCGGGGFEEFPVKKIPAVNTVNTIGSGDAFTAGLASALDEGLDFRGALEAGTRCGAANARLLKPGVII
ncbi:MAG: PfkB family carbohydrate kinase [Treponema sp.]|jgi:1-phosphofructokinase/tagatose 6-phosphate kinase|nr:PfkB family carbohydrate kinase [Treponema sp.]